MYSEKLEKVFGAAGVEIGDIIEVESKDIKIEGTLMPKTEMGDPNTIIIKMKNGYNAGVLYGENVKIRKLKSREKIEFPLSPPKVSEKLPRVAILWTGGTIGSKVEYKTGGVSMIVKPEELFYYIPELAEAANIVFKDVSGVASEDMTYIEWQRIADETAKALNGGARGVVITHGTDTMHFTASVLSFMLKDLNAPVVLTGSQRSGDRGSSDAFLNLISAVRLAANSNIAEVGICMHATSSDDKMHFIRGSKARKMHTSRRDAFRPINDRPIAYVTHSGDITYTGDYRKIGTEHKKTIALTKYEPKVALVKAYPNSDPEIMDYYVEKGYRGIIIEGTGLGHTPTSVTHKGRSWLPFVEKAVQKKVVVGVTSQCLYGRVNTNVYRNLRLLSNTGAVHCEDMLPETAYVKLGWLLGNYKPEEAKEMLGRNLTGEIKERIREDEFLI
jgi:glutamyl-tRNA(Gln) amidotransferase subunit D